MSLLDKLQTLNILALARRIESINSRMGSMEERMDTIEEFATVIDSASNSMAEDLRTVAAQITDLRNQIDAGTTPDLSSLDAAVTKLNTTADALHQMAADPNDPVPASAPTSADSAPAGADGAPAGDGSATGSPGV